MKIRYWTVIYSHRHGVDAWPVFEHQCGPTGPTEESVQQELGDLWEGDDDESEYIEIMGARTVDVPDDETTSPDGAEVWYTWREESPAVDGEKPRLLVPWRDPVKYQFPFDFIYKTPEAARKGLETMGAADDAREWGWTLCKMTLEPIATEHEHAHDLDNE